MSKVASEPATRRKPRRGRGILIVAVVLLILGASAVSFTPHGIDYALEQWFLRQGAESATVRDVDFNPFTGVLALKGIEVHVEGEPTLRIAEMRADIAWRPLLQRRLHVESLSGEGSEVTIERLADGRLRYIGFLLLFAEDESADQPWFTGVRTATVHNSQVRYRSPELDVVFAVDEAKLDELISWDAGRAAHLELTGSFNEAPVQLSADFHLFLDAPSVNATLRVSELALQQFGPYLAPHAAMLEGRLAADVELQFEQKADGALRLAQKGTVGIDALRASTAEATLDVTRVSWKGNLEANLPRNETGPRLRAQGLVEIGAMSGDLQAQALAVRHAGTFWEGVLEFEPGEDAAIAQWKGYAELSGLEVDDLASGTRLLRMDSANLQGVHIEQARQSVGRAELAGLELVRSPGTASDASPALFRSPGVQLQTIELALPAGVSVGQVQLEAPVVNLARTQEGGWRLIEDLRAGDDSAAAEKPGGAKGHAPAVRIGRLDVVGNGQLDFEDQSVSPAYRSTVELTGASLANLDTSVSAQPVDINLAGQIGKHTDLKLSGQVWPFAEAVTLDLLANIDDLSLPPLSPYLARQSGYKVRSGQLDAQMQIKARAGELEGKAELELGELELEPADQKLIDQRSAAYGGMAADAALALLRDGNNVIKLDIPVSGDVSDPKFDLGDAINQAVGKAATVAALSYLKYTLQPFGTIIAVAELASAAAGTVSLQPVSFSPASATLDDTATQYMGKLADYLGSRPKARVKVCGMAVEGDREALARRKAQESSKPSSAPGAPPVSDDELQELARLRAAAVKDALVEQHGISDDRLFVCGPRLDESAEAKPRVDLTL